MRETKQERERARTKEERMRDKNNREKKESKRTKERKKEGERTIQFCERVLDWLGKGSVLGLGPESGLG